MERIGQTATKQQLTLGSLFDGIGGWQLAAVRNGVKPVWSAEIERFPLEVTKFHFPETKQLGDVRNINGAEIEPVDIICAGSPCQNFSQAGNREGLNGKESSLFGEAIRIIREMREATGGQYPEFFVFENVPGMFSSNKGMDFKAVLEAVTEAEIPMPPGNKWATAGMVECPRCEVAWRVLNAEHFGVPQKRKRVFLVGHFRTERRCAGEVLFVEEGLRGNNQEKQSQGKPFTKGTEGSLRETNSVNLRMRSGKPGGGKGALISVEKSLTLAANTNDQVLFTEVICYNTTHDSEARVYINRTPALTARMGTGGGQVPLVMGDWNHDINI